MIYMGKVAQREDGDPVRQAVFENGAIDLITDKGTKRRGRPRQCWRSTVFKACLEVAGSRSNLENYFNQQHADSRQWAHTVKRHSS